MKKLKLIIVALILIVSMSILAFVNRIYSASGAISIGNLHTDGSWYKDNTYYSISFAHLVNYNNIYCIQKSQSYPSQGKYMEVKYFIDINGENAKIYKADKLEPTQGTLVMECEGSYNNLLAAIVSEEEMELGYGSSAGKYNDSQIALYYYWGEWLTESGAGKYMSTSSGNKGIVSTVGQDKVNSVMAKYKDYASKYLYSAKIYYMEPPFNSIQRLLLVERGPKTPFDIDIPVEKIWNDGGNKYNTRTDIKVELLANDNSTGKTLTLNKDNGWKGIFEDLDINDANGKEIKYTIKEIDAPSGYTTSTEGDMDNGYKITNTLLTEVKVIKQWDDKEDLAEFRPSSLKVTLYSNGVSTGKTVTLDDKNAWTASFDKLHKYDKSGKEISYTVQEETIAKYETPVYNKSEDSKNGYITWTITNKYTPHYDGYIEITGTAWLDGDAGKANDMNGVFEQGEQKLSDIIVRLKYIDQTTGEHKLFNPNLPSVYETKTDKNGDYKIVVNYDNSKNVYKLYENIETINKKLETAYVEFEYDGMIYTTVANDDKGIDTSKAVENETKRNNFDKAHSNVISSTPSPEKWTDRDITAATKNITSYEKGKEEDRKVVVKYCNGDGTCDRTNPEGAWNIIENQPNKYGCDNCPKTGHEMRTYDITVEKIPNINLGLFKREQPNVALFSDVSKVEVEMNNQRYTYMYGVRSNKYSPQDANYIQTKFQNKDVYTYRRPVNPADIGYLKAVNKNAMEVYVTYEITIGNLSNTLTITVDSISNDYDSNYLIKYGDGDDATERYHITYGKMDDEGNITGTPLNASQISNPVVKDGYSEITLSGLGIKVTAEQGESENKIYIRYRINQDILSSLFDNQPPLNNASEILSYTTTYGKSTLYAELGVGKREGKPYGGYDNDSHPGNAGIVFNTTTNRLESTKLVEYVDGNGETKYRSEDDTDIAPAFVLCKDSAPKVLSGTVWEDTDYVTTDNERLGDGKKSEAEQNIGNVKVELYKVNNDGSTTLATLYKVDENGQTSTKPAIAYSSKAEANKGYYSFGRGEDGYGVVTDTYLIKYTYGEGIPTETGTISTEINNVTLSGRDYKSTIIAPGTEVYNLFKGTSSNKEWHLNIDKGLSVAVDEMDRRIALEDLQYSNYDDSIYMVAQTKPFEMQLEFCTVKNSTVKEDGKTLQDVSGTLKNELNVFDFGIIERPYEDIFVQKTITNIKITLANGQILAEGNPTDPNANINYTKTMGFRTVITNGEEARRAFQKRLLVEMDTELIQGAKLEVDYIINVVNNSEKDYDYYVNNQVKTEYYYFGTNDVDNSPVIKTSVYVVDYVDSELDYKWKNSENWSKVTGNELRVDGKELISQETLKTLKAGKYIAYGTEVFKDLAPGETSTIESATAKKTLANKDENVYENHVEILKVNAKAARTIEGRDESGTPVHKLSKPGNYVPSTEGRFINDNVNENIEGRHEQDDDEVLLMVTPPTGITSYIITYVIIGLIGLLVIAGGVIFIKKKVLIK